ncbi:PQQ-binding-like beta-propeller repeat protein [Halomicrococcus gelatinilyticus]|uniref:PQQ-binding-like beta-propeller repeat protein n=1 Tax=Halomicrococcus gelatinilyticus TaxID=1702103 RepID=UPI002E148A69
MTEPSDSPLHGSRDSRGRNERAVDDGANGRGTNGRGASARECGRRRFLVAAGVGTATSVLAGCLSQAPGDEDETTTTDDGAGTTTERDAGSATAWPLFGHDARNSGHAPDATGPASDAAVEWRFDGETPTMNSSPAVVDGTVYVPGSGDPGYVHAVDAETGEAKWRFEPDGYASSAPAVVDGTVYFGTWGRKFYALDAATGDPVWTTDVGHRFGSSSPVVDDGVVYVGTVGDGPLVASGDDDEQFESCAVLALDAASGDERWRYDDFGEKENVEASPALADSRVYVGSESELCALDAATGDVAWQRTDVQTNADVSPAVVDGVVYYGAPNTADDGPPANLYAFDAATGDTRWTTGIDDVSLRTSPAIADGTVYVAASSTRTCILESDDCSGTTRGRVYAVDAATGERQWMAPIETDTRSSPAVVGDRVYVGCNDGVSAVTTDGESAWRVDFEGDREDGPYVKSSPAVADGRLFVGASDGRLRAISE